ncbi:trimethylguanosine synthase [Sphingomonas sp. CARO-RG-8B-R24-01]|uniref:trimethylguanosine synthase n=1 Tax=Sphingomonas sp. CARO-RG-8B-R24-01 TaxID=2914831 RepID=UPI001F58F218|nr:trimethylguanosine synthase [Sphingomonas sp. CARO-RG-8B-R24-01]
MPAGNVAQNHRSTAFERAAQDWYVEPRFCVEQLADAVSFEGHTIWDPCCGGGNITNTFADRGHAVIATDIVDRGARHFGEIWDATTTGAPLCVPTGARVTKQQLVTSQVTHM